MGIYNPSSGSGSGSAISGTAVNYAALPAAASHTDELWRVTTAQGTLFINRKPAGIYQSDGAAWTYVADFTEIDEAEEIIYDPTGNATLTGDDVQEALDQADTALSLYNTYTDAGGDTTCWVVIVAAQTGLQVPLTDGGITYNATTNILTATGFAGALTGNASTATQLATPRKIGNVDFDGTAAITPQQIQPASESSDNTCFITFFNAASGTAQQPKYNATLGYDASTGNLQSLLFNGLTISTTTGVLTMTNGKTLSVSNTITLTGTDGVSMNVSNQKVRTIGFSATTPVAGQQGSYVVFPVAGTITGFKIVSDAGTATVKVWKKASGTAAPTVADLINTSGVSLATGTALISSTVSDFTTTTVAANDIFAFDLSAVAGSTKLLFELEITVT